MTNEPTPERPDFDPGYLIPDDAPDAPAWSDVDAQLAASRNYWICTTRANGAPHSTPVWGLWSEGALWFGAERGSVKMRNLSRDPRVSVHLESGDDVVILEGHVELVPVRDMPPEIEPAFWGKYEMEVPSSDDMDASSIRLAPSRAFTWREQDFQRSVTRWRFER